MSFYVMAGIRGGNCVPVPLVAPRVVVRRSRKARLERERYWRIKETQEMEATVQELSFRWMAAQDGFHLLSGSKGYFMVDGLLRQRFLNACAKKYQSGAHPGNQISLRTASLRGIVAATKKTVVILPQQEKQILIVEDDEAGLGEIKRDLRAIRADEVGTMCLADHDSGDCTLQPRELAWITS